MEQVKPRVSILMTAYNRALLIGEAIQSVIDSSYKNWELIIVDDCSTDGTVEVAKAFEKSDSRIKVFENKKNLGDYPNRNMAASYASGFFLKYLDSDDTILPNGLEVMVGAMEKFPTAGLGLMEAKEAVTQGLPELLNSEEAYKTFFFKGRLINMGPSGSIIKRRDFELINGFSEQQFLGDTDFWYRLAAVADVVVLPPTLIWWREHEGQQIKIEQAVSTIHTARFLNRIEALEAANCPLSAEEKNIAIRNTKNILVRKIIKCTLLCNFKKANMLLKGSQLTLLDFFFALGKNKYPKN